MAKTKAVLAQARTALQKTRKQLASELDAVDRALTALKGVGGRAAGRTARRKRRKSRATPRMLAALKKARAARKRKLAEKRGAAS
jgi:hypothetical protein